MNQFWLPNSEGYAGFVASSAHSYQPYFTTLSSLPGPGTQGLLAVSATAKSDGQRIPASHHTRNSDPWEGPPSKLSKTSPHALKESTLSPKTSTHPPAKLRHTSGSEDRKASKHDSSRSRNKERVTESNAVEEKKEPVLGRYSKMASKEKGNGCDVAPKQEQKLESDLTQDSPNKMTDKSPEPKQKVQNNPLALTVEVISREELPNVVSKCNGDSIQSSKKDSSKANPGLPTSSPKSKESSSEKRKKSSKRKDLSVDVNGNAVLSSIPAAAAEKKVLPQTSTVVCATSENSTPASSISETKHTSCSTHLSASADTLDITQAVRMDTSNGNSRSPTGADAVPLTASPPSSTMVPSSGKPSPPSNNFKVTSATSAPLLPASPVCSTHGTTDSSSSVSPSGAGCSGVNSVPTGSPGVMSASAAGDCIQRTCSSGDALTTGVDSSKIKSPVDAPTSQNSSGLSPPKGGPFGAGLAASDGNTLSPLGATSSGIHPAGGYPVNVSPKGMTMIGADSVAVNPSGAHLTGTNPKETSPVEANPTRDSPTRASLPGTCLSDIRTAEASSSGVSSLGPNPTGANLSGSSPTGAKPPQSSPSVTGSLSSPHSVISGDLSRESPVEKEKLPSPRSLVPTAAFNTCVTSSVSKPISFPAHASMPSPSSQSQPSYISHLPIYLHGTGHLSLEREVGRETPRDGSKVHATTFVPALGEFIPGPASSATVQVKESKAKTSANGKESSHGSAVNEKEKDKGCIKKEFAKVGTTLSTKEQIAALPKSDIGSEKTKVGTSHQDCGAKIKESMEVKSALTKGKSEKVDRHEKSKKTHSSSKSAHESRDHHLSPSDPPTNGKDRGNESSHRTASDSIHREACRTSDAAIISTTPNMHSYPHHMAGYSLPLGGMVPSSRDGGKLDASSTLYSADEQRRYLEWHMAAAKRGYCYEHPGVRVPGQEPPKLDPGMMHRTPHQPSFPSPRTDSRPELIPEHSRSRDFPPYTAPQESMLRSVLTAGIHQAHSDTQRTSPGSSSNSAAGGSGSSSKATKQSCETKTENRSKSTSHGSKTSLDSLGSQGRSTPGIKGSDGRNPPVGIAVAQKRQDSDSLSQGRPSTIATPRTDSPHVGSEEAEDRGARSRALHGVDRDSKHREHSPRSHREATDLLPPTKYHHHRYPGDLGSNLIVTGGTSLGHSPHHFDPTDGRMTPSHPAHLALPPPWLPRAPGPPHAPSLWLGHPFGLTTPPATPLHAAGEGASSHLQVPPAGFQVARDPATGQLVLVPQAPAVHSDSGVPPNLSMWPYLVPPHLQPHSHQLQQLVLNQPSFAPPLPHQSSHPLTHRPDQPLPNADYHLALQQHEALIQWYRQDEQRQREEQRRREQQSRKGSGEKVAGEKSGKSSSGVETKSDSHSEKQPVSQDVLNLKIPAHTPYLPGVPLPGQPPVPYVYPPQQVQYLYNHAGVFPAPAVSCSSSPRTESGASTASPKQTTTKSSIGADGSKNAKHDISLKTALKSISVQTSPSETPASMDSSSETKHPVSEETEDKDDKESHLRTEESEDQELIIVDVVNDDASDNPMIEGEKPTEENKNSIHTNSETEPAVFDTKPVEDLRTSRPSSVLQTPAEIPCDVNLDPTMTQKMITETVLPIAPLATPPLDTELPSQEGPAPMQEEAGKESLISNVLTTTQSFASRMEALDQDQLAAIEGIALLSEVADQKVFSICNADNDKTNAVPSCQTRDDSYLLDSRHQDNGTPLQGNTASALTAASGGTLQLITQSCPTSPTDFIFKRSASGDGVDSFATAGDILNPNEVEMTQRLAELHRKYQEKKRELDKLQRKKDKKDKGSRCLEQDRRRGPGRPRKRKISKEPHQQESGPCPIIKSSTAVLLEAAASLEENSPFLVPKKKKKKDREDKEKGRTEEKKKSSKKDKEAKASHCETSKSKKRKHKLKDDAQASSPASEDLSSPSGGKAKSKSKSKSKSSPSLSPSAKDSKQKSTAKSRKISLTDSASSDSLAKSGKSPKTTGLIRSPRSQNSSTEFDTDSGSIIWPSSSTASSSKTPTAKSKSKSSKKKTKDAKAKDSKKDGVKGQGSSDPTDDTTMEAIESVIRKSCDGQGNNDKEPIRSGPLEHSLHLYAEDDSDSPWETAMLDAKLKRNSAGHTPQKGLALLAGISSQELMKSTRPTKESKTTVGKDAGDGKTSDADSAKKKSGKAKKRSISPASSEQETSKKARKMSPVAVKKEKDFESPSKPPKATKPVKKKEKTPSDPTPKAAVVKQEKKDPEVKPFFNEEIWTRRRSERIFLSDISPGPSRDASPLAKSHDLTKSPRKTTQPARPKAQSESKAVEQGANNDHNSTANIGSVLDALKTDTLQIRKKLASMSAQEDEKDDTPRKTKKKLTKKRDQGKKSSSKQDSGTDAGRSKHNDDILDSSCSEAENLPLSNLLERQNPHPPRSCIINKDELQNGLRVLIPIDGLFYAGYVNAIQPPDVYGVILDGERGKRPHVFSQEQMLQETFVDVKPLSTRFVPEGTRVCAYWSQQFRCLYPGTVVKGTPNPNEDPNFVCVEFDDGDSGRIPVDHIRMLPHDFPIVEFEPIPAELQRKRRRRTSDTSCSTSNCKQETADNGEGPDAAGYDAAKAKTSPIKKKPKVTEHNKSASEQPEMDRIPESGEDDVFLPHPQKVQSKSKKSKSHDKSKKSSSKVDSKLKEKKKKKKRKRDERRQESGDHKSSKRSSSKSPRRSPARSPSRSPGKSKKKKRKEDRKKKSSSKLSSSNSDSSPKSKSSKKKSSSSSSSKRKSHRDDRHSSFCTVETETVYSTHPITGSQVLTEEESASETPTFDSGKGVWNKHRDTRDHSLDDWSSSESSKDSSSDSDETSSESLSSKDNAPLTPGHKSRSSCLPSTSKMTGSPSPSPSPCNAVAFLPARQLWNWFGKATQRRGAKGKARKVFYRAIMREKEIIRQGDAAVFLSTGRPHLPYIGRIESMWESWGGNMVVRVKWFYHPEETKGGRKSHDGKMALYQSLHVDENDVQTISHKCEVLSIDEYKRYTSGKKHKYTVDSEDVYYLAGTYDPTSGHITSVT
ncbi:trinucleotide repeat-containing gene 18 protein-like isoform X2 [Acanthaster planci]|nr:trinucleotide repeat-containing gene 18 protein-like isoform X2 [Acanthaster planci]